MPANMKFRCGPLALTTSVVTLLHPGTTTGGTNCTGDPWSDLHVILYEIILVDKGGAGGTVTLYLAGSDGGFVAGTELAKSLNVPANGMTVIPYYGGLRLSGIDYLTGAASAGTEITFLATGEIGVGF